MFKIMSVESLEKEIDEAFGGELNDITLILPEVINVVKKSIMWGIFSNEDIYDSPKNALGIISYDIIVKAKEELDKVGEKNLPFFDESVEKVFCEKDLTIEVDYEDCAVDVIEGNVLNKKITSKEIIIAPTLPDSDTVFSSLVNGDLFEGEKNTWLFPYMDKYDEWKYEKMDNLSRYLWQIGGHGRWIQGDYNGRYVAQANIDIGDAGSVFIDIYNEKVTGGVDMY